MHLLFVFTVSVYCIAFIFLLSHVHTARNVCYNRPIHLLAVYHMR